MRWEVRSPWQLLEGWILANSTLSLLSLIPGWHKDKEIQMKMWSRGFYHTDFNLYIKQWVFNFLPNVLIPLSVQASQTYLFPTHPFPLLLSGWIWRIHGAGRSCETNINLTISFQRRVSWWRPIPKSPTNMIHKRLEWMCLLVRPLYIFWSKATWTIHYIFCLIALNYSSICSTKMKSVDMLAPTFKRHCT